MGQLSNRNHQMSAWMTVMTAAIFSSLLTPANTLAQAPDLNQINQLIRDGKNTEAAEALKQLDDAIKSGVAAESDLTVPLAIVARGFEQTKDWSTASALYQRSLAAARRPSASELPEGKIALIRLAASSAFVRTDDFESALQILNSLLAADGLLNEQQTQIAVEMCLHMGSQSLSNTNVGLAQEAYGLAAKNGSDESKATAMLGEGWALAMSQEDPVNAAQHLKSFVEEFPAHQDAALATALRVDCLRQANMDAEANLTLQNLLTRWPTSPAATNFLGQYSYDGGAIDPAVETWMLKHAQDASLEIFSPAVTRLGLAVAAKNKSDALWEKLSQHLVATDTTGQSTSDALQELDIAPTTEDANRLASILINSKTSVSATSSAREAAARWAGRKQNWSLLAWAADATKPDADESNRTVTIERLFAESLMQTGRPGDAKQWWDHLVDERGVTDFATLLRCAETATSLAEIQEASERISAAHQAAGADKAKIALVDMLSAELAIRQLRFDQARSVLESVVQSSQATPSLRSRAQWMIGETYYLQQKFVDAIEAYRRVEGIDPGGAWVSVALVQAGKAFEHLGRTREATVCYSTLVGRFSNSQHASVARRRLARISPSDTVADPNTNTTIRR